MSAPRVGSWRTTSPVLWGEVGGEEVVFFVFLCVFACFFCVFVCFLGGFELLLFVFLVVLNCFWCLSLLSSSSLLSSFGEEPGRYVGSVGRYLDEQIIGIGQPSKHSP